MSITQRSPEFEQMFQYFIDKYGYKDGSAFYYNLLREHHYNETLPMSKQTRLKSKKQALNHLKRRFQQKLIFDAMQKNRQSGEFYNFAKRVRDSNPEFQRLKKALADREIIQTAEMHMDAIAKASNSFVRQKAVENFNEFMRETKIQRKNLEPLLLDEKWKKQLRG